MKCCIVRKVPYRLPETSRLVWGLILCEREGLALLFVQRPDEKRSSAIVIASEDHQRVYENANASLFPLVHEDLTAIGSRLRALGKDLSEDEFAKLFRRDDLE